MRPARSATPTPFRGWPLAAFVTVACLALTRPAHADTLTIRRPGDHPAYLFEAEPHLLLGAIDPPGPAQGSGFGLGFRGTLELVDNGFVSTINNTIGFGFGLDFVHYTHGHPRCRGNTNDDCLTDDEYTVNNVWLPAVMQWNFWLSRNWSVFGEPGLALRIEKREGDDNDLSVEFMQFYAGGRYHFSRDIALTLRAGYPTFSVGVSFFL